jgi:hypothetical protein
MRHKPGRNDPCPCGSGRKFKRCCGHPVTARQKRAEARAKVGAALVRGGKA